MTTSYFLDRYPKIYPDIKIIKMTSIEAILVTLIQTLNIFLSVVIILEAVMQNNVSNLRDFQEKNMQRNSVIRDSNFTHDSKTYDTGKLYLSLDSSFFSV